MIYNKLIITNVPSFYKINLYNKIAEKENILVIFFIYNGSIIRNEDFYKGNMMFDYFIISDRNVLKRIYKYIKITKKIQLDEILISGWDSVYMWYVAFFSKCRNKSIVVESSIQESKVTGFKSVLKKIFLTKISKAYVPGKSNAFLLKKLNFQGNIVYTKGVGIFNIIEQPKFQEKCLVKNFLYVGRLAKEKNLKFLIEQFNKLPNLNLNIVGFGPLESELKKISNTNISFLGAIDNKELYKIYQSNDVFILPSLSEPWGLVVEEALNNGLPVIVSNKVGCAEEIVNKDNGLVFDVNDVNSFSKCIMQIQNVGIYNKLKYNISKYDFNKIAEYQVSSYLNKKL